MIASSSSPVAAYARLPEAIGAAAHSVPMLARPPQAPHHPPYGHHPHHHQQAPTSYTAYGYPYGYTQQAAAYPPPPPPPPPPMYAAEQAQAIYAPLAAHGHPSEPSSSRPRPPPPPRPPQPQAVSPEQPFQRPRYRPAFPEHSEPDLDPAADPFGGTSFSYAFLPAGPTPDFPGAAAGNSVPLTGDDDRLPYSDIGALSRPGPSGAVGGPRPLSVKAERLSPAGSLSAAQASPLSGWSSSGPASAAPAPADELDVQGWSGPSPNSAASSANGSARPSLGPKQSSNEESVSSAGADGDQADAGGGEDGQTEVRRFTRCYRLARPSNLLTACLAPLLQADQASPPDDARPARDARGHVRQQPEADGRRAQGAWQQARHEPACGPGLVPEQVRTG